MYNIEDLRQTEFPLSRHTLYFNHASISPLPQRTKQTMQWAIEQLAENPVRFFMKKGMGMIEALGESVAAHINAADGEEIVYVPSTSFGINLVAQTLTWEPDDNIVFCEMEFPSNAYPWMSLERDGVEVRQATAVHGGLVPEELEKVVDENTRLVAVSAIQFFSGHKTDLEAIGRFCHERDILFVVDAIQAIGHMKIDVEAMHIDALATGGQKSILAAPGIGFLYVRRQLAESMTPRLIGGNATKDFLHWLNYDLTPLPAAQRFNMGTPNVAGLFGLLESVQLLKELGVEHIDRHTTALTAVAIEKLAERDYHIVTPRSAHGPIVTYKTGLSSEETDKLVAHLAEKEVVVVKHLDPEGEAHIRLSFHAYNTEAELDAFFQILDASPSNREIG